MQNDNKIIKISHKTILEKNFFLYENFQNHQLFVLSFTYSKARVLKIILRTNCSLKLSEFLNKYLSFGRHLRIILNNENISR